MARIGIEVTAAHEQSAGIGKLVYQLVETVLALAPPHQLVLFSAKTAASSPFQQSQHAKVAYAPLSQRWLLRFWRVGIPLHVERWTGSVDLFHATDFVLPPLKKHVRAVLTIHDLAFIRVPDAATSRLRHYLNAAVKHSLQRADLVVTDSRATMQDVMEIYRVPESKLAVIYPALPKRRIASEHCTVQDYFPQLVRPYLLSVGTVQPRKNYSRIVQALARLRQKNLDVDFVIAGGKGWLQDELYQTIQAHRLEAHVHVLGYVPENGLHALYHHAQCLVYPSLYEGFGFPILEGMSYGVPVITSTVSSMPEVAGDAALLVNPYDVEALADSLYALLTDTALRQRLIERGYQQTQAFSWTTSAQQLLQLYDRLL